jgi:hypothetical protein
VKLTVAIPHHPARDDMLPDLLARLGEPVKVVIDRHPKRRNPWLAMKEAWRVGIKLNGTHHLMIENDALPCRDFLATVREVCEQHPDEITKFYTPDAFSKEWREVEQVAAAGGRLARVWEWSCLTAVVMPTYTLEPFLHWAESYPTEYGNEADIRLREWMNRRWPKPMQVTVPSLVEHLGDVSLVRDLGKRAHRALSFIGDDQSALGTVWQ